ncbi:T-complex protein 1 subunit zeta-2 isoform X10 [Mustela putorius furo]|uniref:T-complex protein 1 subunit zeta-2 isoform X10 n=1 Tax=Mustela putorius furo TaxID=9669 RepID=A0A8U0RK74_MUSPF|nr:T-complex protein 1 subunit zeta-2 isoform X10 [Mustela putorius furo]
MAAIKAVNCKAEVARAQAALAVNICAARGLQDVLRTNLGPKGTMKMLVSGAGDIKLTKDGNVLLHEMQIQHPTASLIAKVATAQDDITGDGTTSNVLIIGELLKQADLYISESVVDSVLAVRRPGYPIDLFMVEIMEMKHQSETDTKEVSSGFFYKTAEEKEKLVKAERKFIEDRVQKIIDLKDRVCAQSNKGFVVINQKGIDPFSLDALAKHGIVALRRAKRRNMERLSLACGGMAVNCLDDLTVDCLGHAGLVHECALGEEKFTFIEACVNPRSVTLLVKGPNKHTLTQIKDAIRDGLRAIKNAIEDGVALVTSHKFYVFSQNGTREVFTATGCVVPGAGAVEVAIAEALVNYKHRIKGRARLGVQAFADALLIIPKVLAQNSGFELQETLVKVQTEHSESKQPVGIDLDTGEPMVAADAGVWDNYCVKKQLLHSCTVIATNILLVDEIMRAGWHIWGSASTYLSICIL